MRFVDKSPGPAPKQNAHEASHLGGQDVVLEAVAEVGGARRVESCALGELLEEATSGFSAPRSSDVVMKSAGGLSSRTSVPARRVWLPAIPTMRPAAFRRSKQGRTSV